MSPKKSYRSTEREEAPEDRFNTVGVKRPYKKRSDPIEPKAEQRPKPDNPPLDPTALRRAEKPAKAVPAPQQVPIPVSAGDVGKIADYVFNTSRAKMPEMTVIDRVQGRLFPQLNIISEVSKLCSAVCAYRQAEHFHKRGNSGEPFRGEVPPYPDLIDEYLFRAAQWQKSVDGRNLGKGVEVLLADMETRNNAEDEGMGSGDSWRE